MNVIEVYKCFCDIERLRILNLLCRGPLCVCHLVEILGAEQVRISKQLRYMKQLGMVEGERHAQWMVYRLSDERNPLLVKNLKCLQDCVGEELRFSEDLRMRAAIIKQLRSQSSACAKVLCGDGGGVKSCC